MGGRSTLVLVGVVLIVGGYLWLTATPWTPAHPSDPVRGGRPHAESTVQALRRLLVFEPGDVAAIQLDRNGQTRRVERRDGTWQAVEEPAIIDDFLDTLAEVRALMDIAESAAAKELADYGLDPPRGTIVLHIDAQQPPLVLHLGDRNPATTGVYARVGNGADVVLAGALVEWEFDNLFSRLGAGG